MRNVTIATDCTQSPNCELALKPVFRQPQQQVNNPHKGKYLQQWNNTFTTMRICKVKLTTPDGNLHERAPNTANVTNYLAFAILLRYRLSFPRRC